MSEVGAFEAKTHFSKLLDRAAKGEAITITHRGKPVARLIPANSGPSAEKAWSIYRRMRARADRMGGRPFNWAEWKTYRDEGRG